jgi:hypothetical protein
MRSLPVISSVVPKGGMIVDVFGIEHSFLVHQILMLNQSGIMMIYVGKHIGNSRS